MERKILFDDPWIEYPIETDTLFYPENLIFTAQYVVEHLNFVQKHIYNDRYPNAEKFNLDVLNDIDWKKTIVAFDRDHNNVVAAPDAVKNLINLDRRLRFEQARNRIFGGFRFAPVLEIFRLRWVLLLYALTWLFLYRDTILHRVRSGLKTLKFSRETPRRRTLVVRQ